MNAFYSSKCMLNGIYSQLIYWKSFENKINYFVQYPLLHEKYLFLSSKPSRPSYRKSVLTIHWKYRCWSWISSTLATWYEELTDLKRPWCWERLKAGGEGDDRGWDGWMASPAQLTWIWVDSRSWWWTGKPDLHGVTKSQTQLSDWTETDSNGNIHRF